MSSSGCSGQYSSIYVLVLMFTLQRREPVNVHALSSHDSRPRPASVKLDWLDLLLSFQEHDMSRFIILIFFFLIKEK